MRFVLHSSSSDSAFYSQIVFYHCAFYCSSSPSVALSPLFGLLVARASSRATAEPAGHGRWIVFRRKKCENGTLQFITKLYPSVAQHYPQKFAVSSLCEELTVVLEIVEAFLNEAFVVERFLVVEIHRLDFT